jgi:hypothetical protein
MSPRIQTIKARHARTFANFTERSGGITMRPYQMEAAQAILKSIRNREGKSFVVIISRQAGKDELAANLKAFLLARFESTEGGIVEVNPTYKPQTINAITRLDRRLNTNLVTRLHWKKRSDFMRFFGKAQVSFLSGDSTANVVGAVASILLIVNEAQDIEPAIYDKNFAPMVASTNATRVFMGTSWTSQTLLARELRAARQEQEKDGDRRVFMYTADEVRKSVTPYGHYVDGEIARLGRQHPLVKTQYFCEEIDAQTGMFPAGRLALMQGDAPAQSSPHLGQITCFTIDVAGQDEVAFNNPEAQFLKNPGRDAVTLTISSVDLTQLHILQAPIFRAIHRQQWTGKNHIVVFGKLMALADIWKPMYIVIDATGVGEGLWAMLDHRYPGKVIPVKFTASKKSDIGYHFLGIIETGRFRDCCSTAESSEQYSNCSSEVLIGPQKTLRWSVPEGTRNSNGELIHDDIIVADALISEVDNLEWIVSTETRIVQGKDPLEEMDSNF